MSELVTDEVVETAARARWDHSRSGDLTEWEMRHPAFREHDTETMRAALEAAAPLIAAKAWEEGYQACRNRPRVDGYLINRANPYQTRADRADDIVQPMSDPLNETDRRPRHFAETSTTRDVDLTAPTEPREDHR